MRTMLLLIFFAGFSGVSRAVLPVNPNCVIQDISAGGTPINDQYRETLWGIPNDEIAIPNDQLQPYEVTGVYFQPPTGGYTYVQNDDYTAQMETCPSIFGTPQPDAIEIDISSPGVYRLEIDYIDSLGNPKSYYKIYVIGVGVEGTGDGAPPPPPAYGQLPAQDCPLDAPVAITVSTNTPGALINGNGSPETQARQNIWPTAVLVDNVSAAIAQFKTAFANNGNKPFSGIIADHGSPSIQQIGSGALQENWDSATSFGQELQGKLNHLLLLGCCVGRHVDTDQTHVLRTLKSLLGPQATVCGYDKANYTNPGFVKRNGTVVPPCGLQI